MDSHTRRTQNKKPKPLHQLEGSDSHGMLQDVREVRTDRLQQSTEVLPTSITGQQCPSSAAAETIRGKAEENCSNEENITSLSTVTSAQPTVLGKSKKKKKKKKNKDHHQTASAEEESSALGMNRLHNSGMASLDSFSQVGTRRSNFDQELHWCLEQLHIGLARPDASKPQKLENEKLIRMLRSSKTPLPRKRQLMRSLFGDYRSKMSKEPVSAQLEPPSKPSISSVEAGVLEERGRFFKKSLSLQQGKVLVGEEGGRGGASGREGVGDFDSKNSKQFCFNFDIDSDT